MQVCFILQFFQTYLVLFSVLPCHPAYNSMTSRKNSWVSGSGLTMRACLVPAMWAWLLIYSWGRENVPSHHCSEDSQSWVRTRFGSHVWSRPCTTFPQEPKWSSGLLISEKLSLEPLTIQQQPVEDRPSVKMIRSSSGA